jgi:transcriptional regulator with XRE-family HTH domain
MTLQEWIAEHALNQSQAAQFFRVSKPALSRWLNGAIPHPDAMRRIYRLTRGAVRPESFYDFGRARPRRRRAPRKPFDPFQPITATDIEAMRVTEDDIRAATLTDADINELFGPGTNRRLAEYRLVSA